MPLSCQAIGSSSLAVVVRNASDGVDRRFCFSKNAVASLHSAARGTRESLLCSSLRQVRHRLLCTRWRLDPQAVHLPLWRSLGTEASRDATSAASAMVGILMMGQGGEWPRVRERVTVGSSGGGMSQSGREEKRGRDELGRWEREKEGEPGEMLCTEERRRERHLFAPLVDASLPPL